MLAVLLHETSDFISLKSFICNVNPQICVFVLFYIFLCFWSTYYIEIVLSAYQLTFESVKSKVLPYSLPSAGPEADLGVQAVNPQVTF